MRSMDVGAHMAKIVEKAKEEPAALQPSMVTAAALLVAGNCIAESIDHLTSWVKALVGVMNSSRLASAPDSGGTENQPDAEQNP